MKKTLMTLLALSLVCILALTGCGAKQTPTEATAAPAAVVPAAPQPLELTDCTLRTSTWSSPNGATVHLTATPKGYEDGQSAAFVIRLEGEDVLNIPCTWDGTAYTADAELNAADGYCYYVTMTSPAGETAEIPVNTPTALKDEALINMAQSLHSYCNATVETISFEDGKLTITAGSAYIQAPTITNENETITVSEAQLVLWYQENRTDSAKLTVTESESVGGFEADLKDTLFSVPAMEDDQQLTLTLEVTLSNGQTLSCAGGTFFYNEGNLLTAVG